MSDNAIERDTCWEVTGPTYECRYAKRALPIGVFLATKRHRSGIGPGIVVRSVVSGVHHYGVVSDAELIQQIEQFTDMHVMLYHAVTIFILTGIILNFAGLFSNVALASSISEDPQDVDITIFVIVTALIILINAIVLLGLKKGRQTRYDLLTGLMKMYQDQKVDQYYNKNIMAGYNLRYRLFTIAVLAIGSMALAVPFVIIIL